MNYNNDISIEMAEEPCEMTAEIYRQRMMQAFQNADCDELSAICVLPTEKEFEHLEWLLKNHYKKEPCEDCVSREAVDILVDELARAISDERCFMSRGRSTATIIQDILDLSSVTPQPKVGGIECDVLDKIRVEIMDWQTDIHDNENDAETHDFVFERIYEILDEYKAESDKEVER